MFNTGEPIRNGVDNAVVVGQANGAPGGSPYYFTNVTFQVEGTLFRVSRHYFEQESNVFRDMFELPVASGAIPDGSSDEHPLRLDGINREDFVQLLRALFPTKPLIDEQLSVPQWTSVLRLSDLWQMDMLAKIVIEKLWDSRGSREDWIAILDLSDQGQLPQTRTLAIQKLFSMFDGHGIDKVLFARRYKAKAWLQTGLRELVQRYRFFSDAEETQLGWQTVFKLCRIRDNYNNKRQPRPYEQSDIDSDIGREFQSELDGMLDEDIYPRPPRKRIGEKIQVIHTIRN